MRRTLVRRGRGPENVVTTFAADVRVLLLHFRHGVVILDAMYIRTVKVPSSSGTVNEYVRVVEAYREGGKVKQRVVADLGRKDVLQQLLPKLERVLRGTPTLAGAAADVDILQAWTWGPLLVVRTLGEQLGLWRILDEHLGRPPPRQDTAQVPYADRALVLIANRLIRPSSEHGLARWLETDFVCDRQGRRFVPKWQRHGRVRVHFQQLQAWYRTLDRLVKAKSQIEVALFQQLRDLFSLQPDLVLYDITSTYFEGKGPASLAKHGYSRDGKPHNVQVVVGLVMVAGWPIAHHVWAGNRLDVTTVTEVVADLVRRFAFRRVVFVGDRGMVSEDNLEALQRDGHGYLVGLRRRRNAQVDAWLQQVDESKWQDCPLGITARERRPPLRTRVQEVATGNDQQRVFVIDSEERRLYEQAKREQALARTRLRLERLQQRVASGELSEPARIGAAAERALRAHHGYRYYAWEIREGAFRFFEDPVHWPREQRLEGRYVIASSEKDLTALEAVAWYKQLIEVEHSFRNLKDVLAMRPIYHRVEPRVQAHIFVAALALLLQRLLEKRLDQAGLDLSGPHAMQAVESIRLVEFQVGRDKRRGVSTASPQARQVLQALGITDAKPPTPAGPAEVM
jgi:transposase